VCYLTLAIGPENKIKRLDTFVAKSAQLCTRSLDFSARASLSIPSVYPLDHAMWHEQLNELLAFGWLA